MNTDIDAGQIETLKKRLLEDENLAVFWDYYFTHFAGLPSFAQMGRACENASVLELLKLVGKSISGKDEARVEEVLLTEVPEFGLVHGVCGLEGRMAAILYFPEMKAGVIAVAVGPGGRMAYARLQEPELEDIEAASERVQ